ncbi:MAG: hypothetical protein U0325_07145 [Polyangiales bacterium]
MSDPPEAGYRAAHPVPHEAPGNPRALDAFSRALGAVALLPTVIVVGLLSFERLNAGGPPLTWTLLAASLATFWLVVGSARRAVGVLREVPSGPAPVRGRWLAGAALLLSALGVLVGLVGLVITWLSTVRFGPVA